MKQKTNKNSNGFISRLLGLSPFRIFAKVVSHGATQFVLLILVSIAIVCLWRANDQERIKTHNIGIHIGWSSSRASEIQDIQKGYLPKDSIDNVKIHILLNSKEIAQKTGGKYHNALKVDFEGKARATAILTKNDEKKSVYVDSVIFTIHNDPKLELFESFVSFTPYPLGDITYQDSIGEDDIKYTIAHQRILSYENTTNPIDTVIQHRKALDGEDLSISFQPADFKPYTGQVTQNHIWLYSDDIGIDKDSPYYYYYINIPNATNSEVKSIEFQIADVVKKEENGMKYVQGKSLKYNYVHPEPDIIGNGRIVYTSKEKKEAVKKNEGIIIQAVNIEALNRQNRNSFLYSVLVGTGLAFALDIFIQLIRKLKRLHQRK